MTEIQVENCQENLSLYLEHDSGYTPEFLKDHQEVDEELSRIVLVFNGGDNFEGIAGVEAYSISVETDYPWNLSPGQQKAYELLLPLQTGSVYALTTIGKLAEAMDLKCIRAACKRLENLQSLGVIKGLKL